MNERFEPQTHEEVEKALKYFNSFHDGYVEGIDIKFENYKGFNENGEASGIRKADMTIILTVNAYPYGKDHNQLVQVEFIDVKSFEIIHERDESGLGGPDWGISNALTMSAPEPYEQDIFWDFYFLCENAKYEVTCSKLVFINLGYIMNKVESEK